eukprot:531612-Pyramimonas_sp.AAC.1
MTEGAPAFSCSPSIPGMRAELLLNWKPCPLCAPCFAEGAALGSKKSACPYCPGAGKAVCGIPHDDKVNITRGLVSLG